MARIQARKNKKGTTYQATVRMKGQRTIARTFDTKTAAREWAAEVERQIRARRYKDPRLAEVPLSLALERYKETVTVTKRPTTQARELRTAEYLLMGLGDLPMIDISPAVVAKYRDRRLNDVSAYSVRLELALLSHLFEKARKEWEIPVDNPVKSIERPAPPRGRTRFLTLDDARALLAECRKSRNRYLFPYVLTLLHSGMRPGEAAGLSWQQVDLEKRRVLLEETKNQDARSVPLTEAVVAALLDIKAQSNMVFMAKAPAAKYEQTTPNQALRPAFDHARKRAGLDWLRMHDLRHTAASWLIMRGTDIRTLAAILGHRTLQMVLRYTHLLDEHQAVALAKIGDIGID